MRFTFTGKNLNIFDDVKEKAERKLSRLEKFVPEDTEVSVTISKIRHRYKAEVSVPLHKRLLRGEVTANDISACFDTVADVLEKQIVRYKGRLRERSRRSAVTVEEQSFFQNVEAVEESAGDIVIHRTKRFALKPMDVQEAVMEMELLGHTFFVFRNGSTDEVNVVYKRNDGEYGLIEPQ